MKTNTEDMNRAEVLTHLGDLAERIANSLRADLGAGVYDEEGRERAEAYLTSVTLFTDQCKAMAHQCDRLPAYYKGLV